MRLVLTAVDWLKPATARTAIMSCRYHGTSLFAFGVHPCSTSYECDNLPTSPCSVTSHNLSRSDNLVRVTSVYAIIINRSALQLTCQVLGDGAASRQVLFAVALKAGSLNMTRMTPDKKLTSEKKGKEEASRPWMQNSPDQEFSQDSQGSQG